jgi:hypothetical protein
MNSPEQLGSNSQLHFRVSHLFLQTHNNLSLSPNYKMRYNWSVLMRRIKTPPNDYFHNAFNAPLIIANSSRYFQHTPYSEN